MVKDIEFDKSKYETRESTKYQLFHALGEILGYSEIVMYSIKEIEEQVNYKQVSNEQIKEMFGFGMKDLESFITEKGGFFVLPVKKSRKVIPNNNRNINNYDYCN